MNAYLDSTDTLVVASSNSVFFTNPFSVDCGAITINSLFEVGGVTPYTAGNLIIDPSTGEIKAKQNVDAGFIETISVKGKNAAGSTILFDNWTVK